MKPELLARAARWGSALAALAGALLLKRFYSQASADDLRFMLAPTAWLSAGVLRSDFVFRSGEGYLSRELSVLIAPACAGINFTIVAFLSLVLGFGGHFTTPRRALAWLATSAGVAYLATLVVNVARIAVSVALAHLATRVLGLTFQSVHRLIGVVIYLAGLLALCLTVQVWLPSRAMTRSRRSALLVALGCYTSVTLLVPLLGGAATNPGFWSHAAPVSVLVVVSTALLFAARGRTWDDGRHAIRSSERSERVAAQLDSLREIRVFQGHPGLPRSGR